MPAKLKIQNALNAWEKQSGCKISQRKRAGRMLAHFCDFFQQHQLVNSNQSAALAVSGGSDSMALLALMFMAKIAMGNNLRLRVFHMNHQTREACADEEALVKKWAQKLELECLTFRPKINLKQAENFEARARGERRLQFFSQLHAGELLFQGHHIDDSFEWHMRQKFSSGQLWSSIGIALKSGQIRRPLMAFSKKQLLDFLKLIDLPFMEDTSNESPVYQRNFLRHQVIAPMALRFPNYLTHYQTQARHLAAWELRLRESFGQRLKLLSFAGKKYGAVISSVESESLIYDMHFLLRSVAQEGRGQLSCHEQALGRFLRAKKLQGPINLSAGSWLFGCERYFLLVNQSGKESLLNLERNLIQQLGTQIPEDCLNLFLKLIGMGLLYQTHRHHYASPIFKNLVLFLNKNKQPFATEVKETNLNSRARFESSWIFEQYKELFCQMQQQ